MVSVIMGASMQRIETAPEQLQDRLQWAMALIARAEAEGRYGSLTLCFEAGRIVLARGEATFKPPAPGRLVSETR